MYTYTHTHCLSAAISNGKASNAIEDVDVQLGVEFGMEGYSTKTYFWSYGAGCGTPSSQTEAG